MADEVGKLTLRRLEGPIQKFIKVVIPTDLERLHKHQHNIEKVSTHTYAGIRLPKFNPMLTLFWRC